ncbi:guanine nucleotide exchange factor DCK1 [Aspergillus clavatus NRRL 1]|uniref:SH3 and Ded_cyto domain protein, putative n=1 Tax=Aspergillus clavatus (strain ATCC 1007 / CBS 513.65 / DSM 816 / NCTC 3887 / NRRL 1 / QM 1276 / 107) TaxID=344612 RepID=A1CRN4_ASPCL|nr:SH3 and Ded_cyto domain protein, putative [Aspergillus clavatus NRRL 1]EAW08305.1 SH3 and Ded_cyto domain protein, putative [Aspergillus clavatus NRRL 1]
MPWRPLPRIAFAVAIYPFQPSTPADLPLELGDELYIIEQGGVNGEWCRGYLVAPPSLLAGLTSTKGQTLEARVFSGIFPRNCVEIREVLDNTDGQKALTNGDRWSVDRGDSLGTDARSSVAYSQDDEHLAGEVSDVIIAKKGKPSQIFIHRLDDGQTSPVSVSHVLRSSSLPLTPLTLTPVRDPNAPKPAAPVPMLKIGDETPTSLSEPLIDEIASCLREWHSTNLHELLLARQYDVVAKMSTLAQELDCARRQLLHNVLTAQEKEVLRHEVVWKLVRGNKMLGGDVIVRDPDQGGRLLTGEDSAVQLTKLQSEMSMLEESPTQHSEAATLHHLLLEVNAVSGNAPGPVVLAVHLCSQSDNGTIIKPLSETYLLDIPSPESFASMGLSSKLKTLFTDLSATDIGEGSANGPKLYLMVEVRAPETPITGAPLQSRPSLSRGSSSAVKSPASAHQAGKSSLRTRRSMIWSSKPRGIQSPEQGKESAIGPPPQSADSTASNRDRTNSQPTKPPATLRTLGVGLLEVSHILRQEKDTEQIVNIWSPSAEGEEGVAQVDGFDGLIRTLLPSATGQYVRSDRAARIHLHLYPFVDCDSDVLVRKNPTIMHNVMQTKRIGFSQAPTKPRSDIYITVSHATFPPEALLSHPQAGQLPVPTNTGLRNLQLTLEVRTASGARVEKCVFPSSNNIAQTAWRTTITERGVPWNQTIRLNVPTDEIPGSHLIMSIADAPEFPFALAWMPLWDSQAFIRDGPHSLLLHAYDKHTSNIENGKGAYLSLPWSSLGKNESAKDEAITGPLATLRLETYLCSTEYSQDQVILSLLNWRERPVDEVLDTLKRVHFVPEIEIVKQLRNVFDALFGILVENAGNEEYEDLIFQDLVTVLGIVHDRRFNLGPLVDNYADTQFNFPFATPCLIRSYLRLLQASADVQQSRHLRATFKVGRHVLKFIINARQQQKAKEEGIGITRVQSTFNRDLHTIFKSLEVLMRNPSPAMVGSKTLVVQHFHTWLPELSKVIGRDEIIMIALSFMDSCSDVKGLLVLYKLVLIRHYTQLEIFDSGQERRSLVSSCIGWLEPYWGATGAVSDQYRDQVRLSCAIVAQLLKQPNPYLYHFMPKIVSSYYSIIPDGVEETDYLSLLFSKSFPFQVKACKTSQRFDEALVELSAIMAATAAIPNPKKPPLKGLDLSTFITQALEVHNSILNCEAYPESWLSVHVYNHRATVKSLEYLATLMTSKFLPAPEDAESFDTRLWESFFMTLLKVVSSDALALETFPEQRRRAIWKIAGDVREHGAELLRSSWEAIGWDTTDDDRERYGLRKLGGYQVQYVPGLLAPIIGLCLSVHEGLRHVAVEILRTMILSEWGLNQELSVIETEIISSLDNLFKTKKMNESIIQKLFVGELLEYFEGCAAFDEDLSEAVNGLIATVDELLDLFVASQSGSMAESMHTLRLIEYMKDMGREDIFVRYVHELANLQAAAGNYTEAGLALQLHADLYGWDPRLALPEVLNPAFPEQTCFERKESLYFSIIQYFEDARAWAHALVCYKELAEQYEHTVMDFAKLSRAQSSMAKIHESIAKEEKQFPRYFRVVYKGLGFPATLRDKEFIFEGFPHERMATFVDRLQREHPSAQIVSSGEIQDYEGQFLHITPVSAHRDMTHPVFQRSKVPQSVRDHLMISEPCRFSSTLKRHVRTGHVQEQWVEKSLYTTAEAFPNILRRSEIVAVEAVALSPLQTAIERTWRKTQELSLLQRRAASGEDTGLSGLTEALQQLLDMASPSPSCVAHYRQFLSGDEGKGEGEDEDGESEKPVEIVDPMKNALAVALVDHALAIKHALALYSRPAHQATQAELLRQFEEAFAPELASLSPMVVDTPQTTACQSPSLVDSRQRYALQRSISPEQELMRSSCKHARKPSEKPSVSQRISIMNPFKRSNHAASGSVATVLDLKAEDADHDAETATINSRTTAHSQNTHTKRRSFFGDTVHKHGSSVSIATGAGAPAEELQPRDRSISTSHSHHTAAQSHDARSRSDSQHHERPPTASTKASVARAASVRDRQQSVQSPERGKAKVGSPNGHSHSPSQTGGVRNSVMKRLSLLKGVGRKTSRVEIRAQNSMVVHEE